MNDIYIFDNFLNENDLCYLKTFIKNSTWKYGHGNGIRETLDTKYFSTYYIDNFISDYVRNKIEKTISKKLKITRNYLQIQEFGENGGYHTDTLIPNTYTFTIYITDLDDKYIEEANGDFLLKIPNKKHIISVDTYCNRGVLFPSNYLHKGMAYNRRHFQKRTCIAWKFEEIIENI
jgi:hypothetical protein